MTEAEHWALDEATVAVLRATSDPGARRVADLAERYGVPAYDELLRPQPRDLIGFCANPMCGHAFVVLAQAPNRRYCSNPCRWRAVRKRYRDRRRAKR